MATVTTAKAEEQIATVAQEIDRVFAAQRENRFRMANTTARERIARLKRILQWMMAHRQEIHRALYEDFRKPAPEVDLSEILFVKSEIKHAVRHLKKWMKPRRVRPTLTLATTRAWVRYEPRGVVLIISPWNYPFNLTVGPLVSALAAGNCVILKPSEHTPHTSALLRRMVTELFPENEVALFEGDAQVAQMLLQKPFDHIFFTGSPRVGKIVMKAAAEHLSTVTLELGGKSPVIIDETANIKDAAEKVAWGKFVNDGQTCIAPDYLLVHRSRYQPFLEALRAS
ncbi:MAG: aldehyde dehydrogenase family protein, partial [Calditrichaeota bacterium]